MTNLTNQNETRKVAGQDNSSVGIITSNSKASTRHNKRVFSCHINLWLGVRGRESGLFPLSSCGNSVRPIAWKLPLLRLDLIHYQRSPLTWLIYLNTKNPSLKKQSILYVKNASAAIYCIRGLVGKSSELAKGLFASFHFTQNQIVKRRML